MLVNAPAPAPVRVPEPVRVRVPAQQAGGAAITELLAKNAKLQNDVNMVTAKYNTLVHQLRAAGMIH
jgi:hypothetical protein